MSDKREKQYSALVAGLATPAPRVTVEEMPAPAPAPAPAPRKRKTAPAPKEASQPGEEQGEDIVRLTAYIPKPLHKKIKITLISEDAEYSFSDLIVSLLKDWAEKH
jgi:hypothetical protein